MGKQIADGLPYDKEDFGMNEDALEVKYPAGHSYYTKEMWSTQVTSVGYWDWAMHQMAQDLAAPEEPAASNELLPIDDLDMMVNFLSSWHHEKITLLKHLMAIPPGTSMQVVGSDGTEQTLIVDGEYRNGFIMGISMAVGQLGKLPFEAVEDNDSQTAH